MGEMGISRGGKVNTYWAEVDLTLPKIYLIIAVHKNAQSWWS